MSFDPFREVFTRSPSARRESLQYQVDGLNAFYSVSVAGGTAPYTYFWDFGDGLSSKEQSPKHVYEAPGVYTVTVRVTDAKGLEKTANALITVKDPATSRLPPVVIADPIAQVQGLAIRATIRFFPPLTKVGFYLSIYEREVDRAYFLGTIDMRADGGETTHPSLNIPATVPPGNYYLEAIDINTPNVTSTLNYASTRFTVLYAPAPPVGNPALAVTEKFGGLLINGTGFPPTTPIGLVVFGMNTLTGLDGSLLWVGAATIVSLKVGIVKTADTGSFYYEMPNITLLDTFQGAIRAGATHFLVRAEYLDALAQVHRIDERIPIDEFPYTAFTLTIIPQRAKIGEVVTAEIHLSPFNPDLVVLIKGLQTMPKVGDPQYLAKLGAWPPGLVPETVDFKFKPSDYLLMQPDGATPILPADTILQAFLYKNSTAWTGIPITASNGVRVYYD